MNTPYSHIPQPFLESTQGLAEHLLRSEPLMSYQAAEERLNADAQAMDLLRKLSEMQNNLRKRQTETMLSEAELNQLRSLQEQLQANDTIQDFGEAQQTAQAYLREVNQEISSMIGIDFSALAKRACHCG